LIISTIALVAVYRRVFRAKPLLFHDVRTPARQERRRARIERWMGKLGVCVAHDYVARHETPTDKRRRWKRGGA
jgi:hypothetical protein